jgi:uncharacterized protein (TIGR03118 family)
LRFSRVALPGFDLLGRISGMHSLVFKLAHQLRCGTAAAAILAFTTAPAMAAYIQQNLVSSVPGMATFTDSDLVNPWGIARSPTSPWWVSDNGKAKSTLYDAGGVKRALVVSIPGVNAAPTGMVFNNTTSFLVGGPNTTARFIFADENGNIEAWNAGNSAVIKATTANASYKGIAIGTNASGNFLFAANFAGGTVDVFNGSFGASSVPGHFTDPNLPAGYAPFGIQNINGNIYVSYAFKPMGSDEEEHAPGLGIVNVFDTDGNLIRRVADGGTLNAPWGLTMAPNNFGPFSGDLLVGNFGDGTINAFDPLTDAFEGQLKKSGSVIAISGLWGIGFGNGGTAGPLNVLYFAAGINDEADGLFGRIAVPEPATLPVFGLGLLGLFALRRRKEAKAK